VLPPLAPRKRVALDRANAMQVGVTCAKAGCRARFARRRHRTDARAQEACSAPGWLASRDVAEAKAKRHQAAAFLEERKAEFDQCTVRAPAAGTRQGSRHPRPVRLDFCVHDARSTEAGREVTDEGLRQPFWAKRSPRLATRRETVGHRDECLRRADSCPPKGCPGMAGLDVKRPSRITAANVANRRDSGH
jgi:hypothetical protein